MIDENAIAETTAWFVDVYACYDLLEAARAQNLLESHGIRCRLIDRASTALPFTIGKFGEKRLSVVHAEVIQAKRLLGKAIQDGYLSARGNFCGARVDLPELS